MTKQEAVGIIYILQSSYPGFYNKQTDKQAEILVDFWASCFNDYEANIVLKALTAIIIKKTEFPPTIAEVNVEIIKMVKPNEEFLDGEAAWGEVQRIMRKYSAYLDEEQEASMNKELNRDECLAKTVRACGGMYYLRMCELENINTLRAQFIKIYNSYTKRKQDDLLLPNSLKNKIGEIQQQSIARTNDIVGMLVDKFSLGIEEE